MGQRADVPETSRILGVGRDRPCEVVWMPGGEKACWVHDDFWAHGAERCDGTAAPIRPAWRVLPGGTHGRGKHVKDVA